MGRNCTPRLALTPTKTTLKCEICLRNDAAPNQKSLANAASGQPPFTIWSCLFCCRLLLWNKLFCLMSPARIIRRWCLANALLLTCVTWCQTLQRQAVLVFEGAVEDKQRRVSLPKECRLDKTDKILTSVRAQFTTTRHALQVPTYCDNILSEPHPPSSNNRCRSLPNRRCHCCCCHPRNSGARCCAQSCIPWDSCGSSSTSASSSV
jgi:hypothetical protein